MELSIKSSTAGSSIMGLSHTQAGKLASGVPLLGFQVGNPGGLLLAPPRGSEPGHKPPRLPGGLVLLSRLVCRR